MSSLLNLPLEIREFIIEQVLNNRRTPPTAPSKSNRADFQDIRYHAWHKHICGIYHEQWSTHCPSNCLPLLLTNHQISTETRSVLDRMKSTSYILDISVLNDVDLFPTWLSVPWITNRISTLSVDVRLFGHILTKIAARRQVGDGGRIGFHWSFYGLLERFLRFGPVDEKKGKPPAVRGYFDNLTYDDRDIAVQTLILDFQSAEAEISFPPDRVDYQRWLHRHLGMDRRWNRDEDGDMMELENYSTRPDWLARYLVSEIHNLLGMTYHFEAYGKILYERIGTIRIFVHGELHHEFDLAGGLARSRFDHPQGTFCFNYTDRVSAFREWKKQTLARREQLGFPVVWTLDPELR